LAATCASAKARGEDIIVAAWPKGGAGDAKLEAEVQHAFDLVTAVRNTRNERGMSPKEALEVQVKGAAAYAAPRHWSASWPTWAPSTRLWRK
jgi:valyl-tRNA synthetase